MNNFEFDPSISAQLPQVVAETFGYEPVPPGSGGIPQIACTEANIPTIGPGGNRLSGSAITDSMSGLPLAMPILTATTSCEVVDAMSCAELMAPDVAAQSAGTIALDIPRFDELDSELSSADLVDASSIVKNPPREHPFSPDLFGREDASEEITGIAGRPDLLARIVPCMWPDYGQMPFPTRNYVDQPWGYDTKGYPRSPSSEKREGHHDELLSGRGYDAGKAVPVRRLVKRPPPAKWTRSVNNRSRCSNCGRPRDSQRCGHCGAAFCEGCNLQIDRGRCANPTCHRYEPEPCDNCGRWPCECEKADD